MPAAPSRGSKPDTAFGAEIAACSGHQSPASRHRLRGKWLLPPNTTDAAENNYLNHKDASRLLALQTKFNNGTLTTNEAQERSDLVQKDTTTNGQQLACTGSTTAACQIVKDDYAQAKQSFLPSQNDIQKWANDKAAGSPYTAGQLIDAYNFAFTKGAQPKTQTSTGDLSSAYDWIVNDLSATAKANGGADVTDKIYMGWATANAPSVAGGITSAILANQALSKVGGQVGAALGGREGSQRKERQMQLPTPD